jgi:hypothetical protein
MANDPNAFITIDSRAIASGSVSGNITTPSMAGHRDLRQQKQIMDKLQYDFRTPYSDPYGYRHSEDKRYRAMDILGLDYNSVQIALEAKQMKDGECLTIEMEGGTPKVSKHDDPDAVYADITE